MNTNFFSQVGQMDIKGDLHLIISKASDNNLVVSLFIKNDQCGDDARKLIPPLNLRGTAEELDNGFFEQATAPIQAVSGLMVDMEDFIKQLEEAKRQSVMEKEKADKDRREKEAREKKYQEAMQKVDELETAAKYRDAWRKVPDPSEFPEQAEAIRKRKSALSAKFAPDLFGGPTTGSANRETAENETIKAETGCGEIPVEKEDN